MFKLSISKSQLITPTDPVLRIESAIDCDGTECGRSFSNDDGTLIGLPPHYHLVESQIGAGTRIYGFGGQLPNDFYETYQPSH
jgi:hypothetical protein